MASSTIKTDWYQTEAAVTVVVLVKNLSEERINIDYSESALRIEVSPSETDEKQILEFNLAHKINPNECSHRIMTTKVEIKLKKQEGIRWEKLERKLEEVAKVEVVEGAAKPPAYPTSKGTNWNEIEKKISEEEAKEKPEGEEALNKLFQEIYGKGSDEVKRAMNKSFMESGGTVLSTNWSEIGSKKVDVRPPDGMEFKKWDS